VSITGDNLILRFLITLNSKSREGANGIKISLVTTYGMNPAYRLKYGSWEYVAKSRIK
jgi:hypothetical protein